MHLLQVKRFLSAYFTLALVAGTMALPPSLVGQEEAGRLSELERRQGYSSRTVLARPLASVGTREVIAAEERLGVRLQRQVGQEGRMRLLELPAGEAVPAAIERLRASGQYEYVEPNYVRHAEATVNDPLYSAGDQWALRNLGQNGGKLGADIGAENAWNIQTDARQVLIAIIDSGMRLTHEDLAANLWVNPREMIRNGSDDDGNGYIDDIHGINSLITQGAPGSGDPTDLIVGHGTAVASVIGAAGGNGRGMTGVAWTASLMPLRFLDNLGFGLVSDLVECIDYAIARRARVINASFGSSSYSKTEYDALKRARDAGIVVVCSAGNSGLNNDLTPHYPSGHLLDNIIAVANTTRTDALASSSDYSSGVTELAAPGTSIVVASATSDTSYRVATGTSYSAPMVTGAVALLRAKFPNDTHRDTINRLLQSVDILPALTGKTVTGGRLNLSTALRNASTRPFHDDFARRATLLGESVTARSASPGATRETGEPIHAGTAGNGSLWWTWTAPSNGAVIIDTADSDIDTLLHVYTGSEVASLVTVAGSDDESASIRTSKVSFTAVAGRTYQIAVDQKGSTAGLVVLRLRLTSNNDQFNSAQVVTGRSWQVTADNRNASREEGEPRIRNNTGSRSLWYRWVPPVTRRYHLSTFSIESNTMIAVYTGSSLSTLTEVSSALTAGDSNYTMSDGGLSFTATAGTTYYIAVDTETQASGSSIPGSFTLACTDSEWEFFGTGAFSTLSVAPNGIIHGVDYYGYLYALDPDGSRKWRHDLSGYGTYSAPAVASDGTCYVGDDTGNLHAIKSDGTRKWRINLSARINSSPALGSEGTIYVRADDGRLHALNAADGTSRWTVQTGTGSVTSYTSPVIAPDGTIYCASAGSRLLAISPAGAVKWTFHTDFIYASPAVAADGTIYIGVAAPTRRFYALRPDGTVKWEFIAGDTVSSSAAIGVDGTVYFGCADKKLYALSAAGDLRWSLEFGGAIRNSSPVIASDGSIIVGCLDGRVYLVDGSGTLRRTYCTSNEVRSSVLLNQGRLYIPSGDYRLYAVETGLVPASTDWPMHRQNLRRSARVEVTVLAFDVALANQTAAVEEKITFVAGAVGAPPLTYQWFFNGQAITGATGAVYVIDSVNHMHGGDYSVRVSDKSGTITSRTARLNISTPLVPPSVVTAPIAQTTFAGDTATLAVVASGSAPLAFQWHRDGVAIRGATTSTLTYASAKLGDSGRYSVTISNFGGTITSPAAVLTVNPVSRIANLSIRSRIGGDAGPLTLGLTVGGRGVSGQKRLLVRAIGPALGAFGVEGFMEDPRLDLMSGARVIVENNDWAGNPDVTSTSTAVGAFALSAPSSLDAALTHVIAPGGYTVRIAGAGDATGIILAEAYDATAGDEFVISSPRLINVSALARVGTGSDILIAGFHVAGATPKTVLVRAIGPGLTVFGVGDVLADPKLDLYAGGELPMRSNDNWEAGSDASQVATAAASVGAFALTPGSLDSVLLVSLPPGSYTAQVSGVGNTTGTALVEVYELP